MNKEDILSLISEHMPSAMLSGSLNLADAVLDLLGDTATTTEEVELAVSTKPKAKTPKKKAASPRKVAKKKAAKKPETEVEETEDDDAVEEADAPDPNMTDEEAFDMCREAYDAAKDRGHPGKIIFDFIQEEGGDDVKGIEELSVKQIINVINKLNALKEVE